MTTATLHVVNVVDPRALAAAAIGLAAVAYLLGRIHGAAEMRRAVHEATEALGASLTPTPPAEVPDAA